MSIKYKVGDFVTVRSDLRPTRREPCFTSQMLDLRGRSFEVLSITDEGYLRIRDNRSWLLLRSWVRSTPAEGEGPTGPVSSLLWEAAKYSAPSINPRSMLNEVLRKRSHPPVIDYRHELAHGFLAAAMDSDKEHYCLDAGEDVMTLLFAVLLAEDAGY